MQCTSLIGYHTTWASIANGIKAGHLQFRSGSSGWDWLGTGAYFWIENERMANLWGRKLLREDSTRAKKEGYCIIECRINLGECLNLANTADVEGVRKLLNKMKSQGFSLSAVNSIAPATHPLQGEAIYRRLDHELIDAYDYATGSQIDTVLGVFNNGTPIYPDSNLQLYSSIQLAVRDRALSNIAILSISDEVK